MATTRKPQPAVAERITVNLIERASKALARAAEADGVNKTDAVNRALQLYDWALLQRARGNELAVIRPDGEAQRVVFF